MAVFRGAKTQQLIESCRRQSSLSATSFANDAVLCCTGNTKPQQLRR
jgi:hypothetical protein